MDQRLPHPASSHELEMPRGLCWHCQSKVAGEYFCDRCNKVQPVSQALDYFTCLGFPRRLMINPHQLETKFYELSRVFHPDFYQNKSLAEQTISLTNSAMLNTAYRTLRDPIQRAEYLLDLEVGAVKENQTTPPVDLFEEILEIQDTLTEYQAAAPASETQSTLRTTLHTKQHMLVQRQQKIDTTLQQLFAQWDTLHDCDETTDHTRAEREHLLKQMREKLSARAYVKSITSDLASTIG